MLYKTQLLGQFVSGFKPVKRLLNNWWQETEALPKELQEQARLSIQHKTFHCLGGSIYALYPQVNYQVILEAIVALQTISDYLDNLCDRMAISDAQAFRQLHLSFIEALDPTRPLSDYYSYYPFQESHYLVGLVRTCREQVLQMPYYEIYQPHILKLAKNYCELQALKHLIPNGERELKAWIEASQFTAPLPIYWNEWSAATGSTLGIFMLFAASYHQYEAQTINLINQAYFPWIQGLHILLDYYIDREEDEIHQDLNFTTYYPDINFGAERLQLFLHESKSRARLLPHSGFHELVIQGLIAMYGSDPKLTKTNLSNPYQLLLETPSSKTLFRLAKFFRKVRHLT